MDIYEASLDAARFVEPEKEEPFVAFLKSRFESRQLNLVVPVGAGMTHHSELTALEIGVRRVGEVLLGCFTGLFVSWLMSKLWPVPETEKCPTGHTHP